MRRVTGLSFALGSVLSGYFAVGALAAEPDASLYVGTKMCGICHKKDEVGNQLGKWESGPHAKAVKTLGTEEAKKLAAKVGVTDPQNSGKCLKCHSTAYNFTETLQVKKDEGGKIAVEDAVTCESCHGPGKNYKKKSVMKDRKQAIANGMVYPATQRCVRCHNDTAVSWKPDRYTTKDGKKVGFDLEQAYEKIKHLNPELHK